MAKTTIEFDPLTGMFYRVKKDVQEIDSGLLMKAMRSSSLSLSPMLAPGSYTATAPDGSTFIIQRIMAIPFRVALRVITDPRTPENVVYLPDFRGQSGGLRQTEPLTYVPPVDQRLLLVVDVSRIKSYLFAQHTGTGHIHYPGLPNTYSNGRLCTGETQIPPVEYAWINGLQGYLDKWLDAWSSCEFNADLNSNGNGSVEAMCVFDPETHANIAVSDWRRICAMVSPGDMLSSVLSKLHERMVAAEAYAISAENILKDEGVDVEFYDDEDDEDEDDEDEDREDEENN